MYDCLIVESGLYETVFAHFAGKMGKACLVVDKRLHLGGNLYCEEVEGINVHKYGAHIFVGCLAEYKYYVLHLL